MYRGTSQQEKGKEDKNHGEGSIQRSDECFVNAEVDYFFEIPVGPLDHIFPDAVEDDNGVMHAVAGDRQNTGDEQQVDLDTYKPAEDGKDAHHH